MRYPDPHPYGPRVQWAQPQSSCEPLNRLFGLSQPQLRPSTPIEGFNDIRVQRERPVDQRGASIEIANNKTEGPATFSQYICIVLSEFDGTMHEP
jgi:hypothetical protein